MTRQLKQSLTLKKLLERFPQGISITPSGQVYQVVKTTKTPQDLPMTPPPGGGYLVVANPIIQPGDEDLFQKEKKS